MSEYMPLKSIEHVRHNVKSHVRSPDAYEEDVRIAVQITFTMDITQSRAMNLFANTVITCNNHQNRSVIRDCRMPTFGCTWGTGQLI